MAKWVEWLAKNIAWVGVSSTPPPSWGGLPHHPLGGSDECIWKWKAEDRQGAIKQGEISAVAKEEVERRLLNLGYRPIRIRRSYRCLGSSPPEFIRGMVGWITQRDRVIFARQFATMVDASLPAKQCLEIIASQSPPAVAKHLANVLQEVAAGATLIAALRSHSAILGPDADYPSLASAEASGDLAAALGALARQLEQARRN